MEKSVEENVMQMAKTEKPKLIQTFENLLWANSPVDWILKSTYFRNTLFISILLESDDEQPHKNIRRSFRIDIINNRANDLWGLARDCIDEIRSEVTK